MLGCINIIAALGLGLFSGMTGILSLVQHPLNLLDNKCLTYPIDSGGNYLEDLRVAALGHIMFFGVGAYVSSWFTLPTAMKPILLPKMPEFILEAQWPLYWAVIPAVIATLLVGVITGLVMRRLRETSAVIASVTVLSTGGVYGLLALGLATVFGLLGFLNFAHGDLMTICGYTVFFLLLGGTPFPIATVLGVIMAGLAAVAMERIAFRPLRGRSPMTLLITTFAISLALHVIFQIFISPKDHARYNFPTLSCLFVAAASNPFGA